MAKKLYQTTSVDVESFSSWSPTQLAELDKLLRTVVRIPFAEYAEKTFGQPLHSWQRDYLSPILDRFIHGKGVRILMHGPPQVGKSLLTSERVPACVLGHYPTAKVFLATYSIEQSTNFGTIVKQLLASDEHHQMFPGGQSFVSPDASSKKFSTPARTLLKESQPSFQALGLLSGFIGKGPTHLIIDDPYKSPEDASSAKINDKTWRFWSKAAKPRISDDCNVLVMFHRYFIDDLAGRLIEDGGFELVRFPILADDNEDGADPTGRQPGEPLSPLRSKQWCMNWQAQDPEGFASMGQGIPVVEGDTLINPAWFKEIDWEDAPELKFYHRGYDLALKSKLTNDETATAIGGMDERADLYIFDMDHWRRDTPMTVENIIAYHKSDPKGTFVVMYDEVTHLAVIQQLAYQHHIGVYEIETQGKNKFAKASGWVSRSRMGHVYLVRPPKPDTVTAGSTKPIPHDMTGSWIPWMKSQCLYFRNSETNADDGIDAVSALYNHAFKFAGKTNNEKLPPPIGTTAYYRWLGKQSGKG